MVKDKLIPKPENRRRLLLLEDNPADADLVKLRLEEIPDQDYEVIHGTTLTQALATLRAQSFDAALLDLNLPDANGLEVVRRVVAQSEDLPIVVLTGRQEESLALHCIEAGAQDFLNKADLSMAALRRTIGFAIYRLREMHTRQMQSALANYQHLASSAESSKVTRSLAGLKLLKEREPQAFEALIGPYGGLIKDYLAQLSVQAPKPLSDMLELVGKMGDLGAGPKDLIDLHVNTLERVIEGKSDARARSYAIEGRLLVLEMMGLLVDYYRRGIRLRSSSPSLAARDSPSASSSTEGSLPNLANGPSQGPNQGESQ